MGFGGTIGRSTADISGVPESIGEVISALKTISVEGKWAKTTPSRRRFSYALANFTKTVSVLTNGTLVGPSANVESL